MPFGQLVVGPPGSGKSTYCNGMQQFLTLVGRKTAVINLDPANDNLPYSCAIDLADLVSLENVQDTLKLGPNGGLLYCIDYLCANLDWLDAKLESLLKDNYYLLFDFPGQVELFTLQPSLKTIIEHLTNTLDIRLAAVHLVDAHCCSDPSKFMSALLLSLNVMLYLELPHVNILSKMDLIEQYGDLSFNLEYYVEVQDLTYLVDSMGDSQFSKRYKKLSSKLCEVVEDYGLVQFEPLAIEDKDNVQRIVTLVDKANGYVFASASNPTPYPPEFLYSASDQDRLDAIMSAEEKFMKHHKNSGLGHPGGRQDLPDIQERLSDMQL